jgi:hypothetical protein
MAGKTVKVAKVAGEAKVARVKGVKALARERTLLDRKALVANLRKTEKIVVAFEKSVATLGAEIAEFSGEFRTQLDSVLAQLNIAVTVTKSQVEADATALARTFIR